MLKKLLVSVLVGISLLFSLGHNFVLAAEPNESTTPSTWYNQTFNEWYNKVYDIHNPDEIFGERYTAAQVQWIIYSLFSYTINSATGPQSAEAVRCFLTNSGDVGACGDALEKIIPKNLPSTSGFLNPQSPGQNESLLSLVFSTNRPFSGISYVKEKVQKLNPVSEVHAATTVGFGYTALQSIQHMWVATRNFAFAFFVIAAIVIAFMIMFRIKISPQVVISVQSALPKIVIALILVTFSYAIAGFLIDLMYVVIGFFSLFLPGFITAGTGTDSFTAVKAFNWMTLGPMSAGIIGGILAYLLFFGITLLATIGAVGQVSALAGLGVAIGTGALGVVLIIGVVILLIVAIIFSFKIWWSLLKAFAMVILLTIAAPLQIAVGVIVPNFGFGAWLKSFLSQLSTFVVTGLLMFLSYVFLVQAWVVTFAGWGNSIQQLLFQIGASSTDVIQAGASSAAWPPLLGGGGQSAGIALLFAGVSFVIFTLIPKASEIVQSFITGKPFAYGNAIGEATGVVGGVGSTAMNIRETAQRQNITLPRTIDKLMSRLQWLGMVGKRR